MTDEPATQNAVLVEAARRGDSRRVLLELQAGVDPNLRDAKSAASALSLAAFGGHVEVCRLLLQHGASWTTGHGETAVDDAVRGGHVNLAEDLRILLARHRTLQAEEEEESRNKCKAEILARKTTYTQLLHEKDRRMRGVRLAQQMQRAACHQCQVEARQAEMARKMEERAQRTEIIASRRKQVLEEENEKRRLRVLRTTERHELERQVAADRLAAAEASRVGAFDRLSYVGFLSIQQVHQIQFSPYHDSLPSSCKAYP